MEDVAKRDESSKDTPVKQIADEKNESGIGVDLNESESCDNHTACSLSINSESEMSSSPESAPAISSMPDASEDISLNCSGMKKDDSGIYSEKSPASGLVKEISDGDLTESITESFEENASLEHRCKMSLGLDDQEVDLVQSEDKDVIEASEDHKITDINDGLNMVKKSDKVNAKDVNDKCKVLNSDSLKPSTEVDEPSDQDDNSDPGIVKQLHRKFVRPLVDYESSDSESTASGDLARKLGKCYRKRKSYSKESSDDEVDDDDESSAVDDGTPVLLRQGDIREPDIEHMLDEDSDDNSDTSDAELETRKDSSESDTDDTPIDVSPFGPPKHKWRALFDLREREHGFTVRSEQGYFRKKIQGSLQMVRRFELLHKMEHHEGCVNALHFNRTGTLLASGSDDLNIVIWNWTRNKPALIYDSGHRSNVFQSKFMPFSGDCHVVSCARDGQIRLADLSSTGVCKGTKKLAQHRGSAHKLALEMDSPHVFLSCGEDAITLEIDLRSDKANKLVVTKENDRKVALYSIHSNPCNSNEFVVSGRDHFIRIYDKRKINEEVDGGILKKFCPHHLMTGDKPDTKANVTCACFNHNGTEVLGSYNDEDIYLFRNTDSDGANYSHKYKGHRNNQTVKGVNFYGPESEFVVSGSDCGHIFLWHKATENVVKFMPGDDGGVINVLEPHPLLPVLATSGLDHDVKVWTPTGDCTCQTAELKKVIKRNSREREEERSGDVGMVDGAMLWYLMHHLRRGRRQREREARRARGESPEDGDEAEEDDDDDADSDTLSEESPHSESDGEIGPHERIQCAPS